MKCSDALHDSFLLSSPTWQDVLPWHACWTRASDVTSWWQLILLSCALMLPSAFKYWQSTPLGTWKVWGMMDMAPFHFCVIILHACSSTDLSVRVTFLACLNFSCHFECFSDSGQTFSRPQQFISLLLWWKIEWKGAGSTDSQTNIGQTEQKQVATKSHTSTHSHTRLLESLVLKPYIVPTNPGLYNAKTCTIRRKCRSRPIQTKQEQLCAHFTNHVTVRP